MVLFSSGSLGNLPFISHHFLSQEWHSHWGRRFTLDVTGHFSLKEYDLFTSSFYFAVFLPAWQLGCHETARSTEWMSQRGVMLLLAKWLLARYLVLLSKAALSLWGWLIQGSASRARMLTLIPNSTQMADLCIKVKCKTSLIYYWMHFSNHHLLSTVLPGALRIETY